MTLYKFACVIVMQVTESNPLISDKQVYREIVNLEKGRPRHCVETPWNTEQVRMFHCMFGYVVIQ